MTLQILSRQKCPFIGVFEITSRNLDKLLLGVENCFLVTIQQKNHVKPSVRLKHTYSYLAGEKTPFISILSPGVWARWIRGALRRKHLTLASRKDYGVKNHFCRSQNITRTGTKENSFTSSL